MIGPAPPELIAHVKDQYGGELLEALSKVVEEEDPSVRFEHWDENALPNLDSEARRVILRMINLDPKKRATIEEILEDRWWKEGENRKWH